MTVAAELDDQLRAFEEGRLVRVVNYHNTPASRARGLEAELRGYLRRFDAVSLDDLDRFYDTGRWHIDRPGFLPVFYDGYRNNATVAARVCGHLGLRAWFFPPTGFLTTPAHDQRGYAVGHRIQLVDDERHQDRLAMTLDELAEIGAHHEVANHTDGHAASDEVRTPDDVDCEVTRAHRVIEHVTGRAPTVFAWRRGTPFDAAEPGNAELLRLGYRYLFSNTKVERIQ